MLNNNTNNNSAGNGDESLQAVPVEILPASKETENKEVSLQNVDAWSELSGDMELEKPTSPGKTDKAWAQFQSKKLQSSIRVRRFALATTNINCTDPFFSFPP